MENQIDKILNECLSKKNVIILYTIVETKLAKYLAKKAKKSKSHALVFLAI